MKSYTFYLFLFILLTFIYSCSYLVKYKQISKNDNLQATLVGYHPLHNFEDSTLLYRVSFYLDTLSMNNQTILGTNARIVDSKLEYNNEIFSGEINIYENFELIEFKNLPFDFIPYEHKHYTEITLLKSDSTYQIIKFESK